MSFHESERTLKDLGDYEVLGKIVSRGQRALYKARQRRTGAVVALKVAPVHMLANPLLRDQFADEYLVASAVPHPHLVRCLAFEEREGTPYLVFEYLDGESLAERISRAGRWTETEAVRILTQVAEAVQAIHDHGVVHGDLKATNILIADDGQAKLMGLGQVRLDDAELGLPNPRTMLNALNFVAPEQFEDGRAVTPRGDIYALGAALYLAVTGDLPFRANGALGTLRRKLNNDFVAARQLVATLSGRTDGAIRRALSMDPVERPASCREWIAELTEEPLCVSCAGQQ